MEEAIRTSIVEALASWDREAAAARRDQSERLRSEFVARFPINAWPTMSLQQYALGQNSQDTVCWWMEYQVGLMPSMKGGSAHKHLIFRSKDGSWNYPNEYESVERAWTAVRDGFVQMFDLASHGRFGDADDIKVLTGSPALRAKLLYTYFPTELIPVSSKSDIDHHLRAIGESQLAPSVVRGNLQLLSGLRTIPELAELPNADLGIFLYHWNNPRSSSRVVKIAPGELGKYWDECRSNGYICVGWDDVGDLTQFEDKDTFRDEFREHYPYNGVEQQVSRKANELWTLKELQPGDQVIANRGTTEILGVGTVNDVGYAWRPDRSEYKHTLGVDWDTSKAGSISPVKAWATTTVSKVSAALFRQLVGSSSVTVSKPVATEEIYLEIEAALGRRGQVILYGPPGTGKTYIANRAAAWLLEGGSSNESANAMLSDEMLLKERQQHFSAVTADSKRAARLTRMTFHPSYGYEDFVEGFRPQQSISGAMQLVLTDGNFKRVCDTARADPNNPYVVLIDEFNRGNIPKIFGELITLIEKDKRGLTVQLPQSSSDFSVPSNVYIIGTMNTADRSIHLLDSALRRRFQFIELLPNSDLLEGVSVGALALDSFLDVLNQKVRSRFGREKQIGHSAFFVDGQVVDTPESFAAMFRNELIPLLQEYLYDDYQALADLLGDVIDTENECIGELASDPEALCATLAGKFGSASA